MKRFSKILLLVLSLVIIATAFTVVVIASDDEPARSTPYVKAVNGDWEKASVKDGDSFGTGTEGKRPGYIYSEVSADGNKYIVFTPGTKPFKP